MRPCGEKDTNSIHDVQNKGMCRGLVFTLLLCAALLGFFALLETCDNKYSHYSVQPEKGVLVLDDTFTEGSYICVIDDWEFYNGQLIAGDGRKQEPQYLFLGEYSNYSMREKGKSGFGQASYRLTIVNHSRLHMLSMEVPELFSASRIYADGELIASLGNVEEGSYQSAVRNQIISFPADGTTELVIEAANYDHYYSGMFYPPILGATKTVTGIVVTRLIIYGIACFSTLSMALFSLMIWRGRRESDIYLIYGFLSLAFGIHIAYPFIRWLGLPLVNGLYAVEDASEYLMILCVILIGGIIAGEQEKKYFRHVGRAAGLMIAVTFLVPLVILPRYPKMLQLYGHVIDGYQILVSLYILYLSALTIRRGTSAAYLLLAGSVVFAVGMLKDVFTSNLFEPIRGAWLKEYSGFLLIIIFSVLLQKSFHRVMEENRQVLEHLEEKVEERTQELTTVLNERKKLLSEVAHDLKAPMSSIQTFIEFMKIGNVNIDEETRTYLNVIEQKSIEMQDGVKNLQKISMGEYLVDHTQRLCVNSFLEDLYENSLPDAEANGIHFVYKAPKQQVYMDMDRYRMTRALENIIYNAFDFTPLDGRIQMSLEAGEDIRISISDSGRGISEEDMEHLFESGYTRRMPSEPAGKGLGLYIAKAIVEAHQGRITVESQTAKGTTFYISFAAQQRISE